MSNTIDANKASVRKIIEMFNTGELSEADFFFSSVYVDHQRPSWLDINGSEEFKQIVLSARKSLPNLRVTIEDVIAEDDRVVVRLQWWSTHPDGKKIERETIDILRFAQRKAVEHWGAEAWVKETAGNDQTL
jgi:predicted SnoaL-like aldol condensation-catalyzing enzyme